MRLLLYYSKYSYLCSVIELGYGVMVTLQILVLTFQVRILVAQPTESLLFGRLFCLFSPTWHAMSVLKTILIFLS